MLRACGVRMCSVARARVRRSWSHVALLWQRAGDPGRRVVERRRRRSLTAVATDLRRAFSPRAFDRSRSIPRRVYAVGTSRACVGGWSIGFGWRMSGCVRACVRASVALVRRRARAECAIVAWLLRTLVRRGDAGNDRRLNETVLAGSLPVSVIHHLHRTTTPTPCCGYDIVIGLLLLLPSTNLFEKLPGKGISPREEIPFREELDSLSLSLSLFLSLSLSLDCGVLLFTRRLSLPYVDDLRLSLSRQREFPVICSSRSGLRISI